MNIWKFTNEARAVVARTNSDGSCESCLAALVPAGEEILPPDIVDARPGVMDRFRMQRETYLDRLAGIAVFTDDVSVKSAAKTFRQRLLDAPQAPSVTGAPDAASLEVAIVTLYRAAAIEAATSAPAGKVEFDRIAK
jgi:hypothetical protein